MGSGWTEAHKWPFSTGAAAYRIEQTVLEQLRVQGHAPFLTAGQMPAGGWTETFDATLVTVEQLYAAVTCALTQPPA